MKNTVYAVIVSSDIHAPIYKGYTKREDALAAAAGLFGKDDEEAMENLARNGYHYNGRSTAVEIATLEYDGGNGQSVVHLIATLNGIGLTHNAFASRQEAYDFVFKTMAEIKGDNELGKYKDIAAKRLDAGKEVEYGYVEGDTHCFTYVKAEIIR